MLAACRVDYGLAGCATVSRLWSLSHAAAPIEVISMQWRSLWLEATSLAVTVVVIRWTELGFEPHTERRTCLVRGRHGGSSDLHTMFSMV